MIEIDGIQYQPRQTTIKKRSAGRLSTIMAATMVMTENYYGMESSYQRQRPNVDIVEEYKLILKRESTLSRNDREWVMYQFEQLYEKITTQS
jgi:hypothetical protein